MDVPIAEPSSLERASQEQLRGRIWELPQQKRREQDLFRHQAEAMKAIRGNGWASGILHLPTGSGKTRIALEYMKERMDFDPNERILWASYPTQLIEQTMLRIAEMGGLFPPGTRMIWYDGDWERERDLFERVDIVLVTRGHLRTLLGDATDGRVTSNPLRRVFDEEPGEARLSMTLIYDECHQLGAKKLQKNWREFSEEMFDGRPQESRRFRALGLSATPLPTTEERHPLLRNQLFPIPEDLESERPEWGMMVHYTTNNQQLVDQEILCRVNPFYNRTGEFDLPESLIDEVVDDTDAVESPPENPTVREIDDFMRQFNNSVMSDTRVLDHLAGKFAEHLGRLGKTLVFVPTIEAANKLTRSLVRRDGLDEDRVSVVHSRLDEITRALDEDFETEPGDQIEAFVERGEEPCIMVNVGMLTTGFDDPNIRTVVLARLTFSTNLFWQMIGRGTRGLEIDGTPNCFVVDPVRLTQRYRIYEGYRPKLTGGYSDYDEKAGEIGRGRLDPDVPVTHSGPGPLNPETYEVDPDVREDDPEWYEDVAEALKAFVDYDEFESLLEIDVQPDGTIQKVSENEPTESKRRNESALTACHHLVDRAEKRLRESKSDCVDLDWLRKRDYLPSKLTDTKLRLFHRRVETVVEQGFTTEEEFERYKLNQL